MPITCEPRPDENLVIFRHVGEVTDTEFLTFYQGFFEDSDVSSALNLLVDLQQTSSAPRSGEALRLLAEFLHGKFGGRPEQRRIAVVAPQHLSFGLARMYEVFSACLPWEFVVFRDHEAALAWLGIPERFRKAGE
jgi:hypothetical protein